jgi:hypothetical protein
MNWYYLFYSFGLFCRWWWILVLFRLVALLYLDLFFIGLSYLVLAYFTIILFSLAYFCFKLICFGIDYLFYLLYCCLYQVRDSIFIQLVEYPSLLFLFIIIRLFALFVFAPWSIFGLFIYFGLECLFSWRLEKFMEIFSHSYYYSLVSSVPYLTLKVYRFQS